jgi:hypothetical protein
MTTTVHQTVAGRSVAGGSTGKNASGSKFEAPNKRTIDLVSSVKGMYRILDLISEQGSGGLGELPVTQSQYYVHILNNAIVDKVIIAQDSLREFINKIKPGAYVSLTKVDFKALDQLSVRPVGIYGSKAEIVKFLSSIGAVTDFTSVLFKSILCARTYNSRPCLGPIFYSHNMTIHMSLP